MQGRTLIAILIILFGLGMLLDQTNAINFWDWWPMFIVAAGVISISQPNRPMFFGISAILIGVVLQMSQFGWLPGGFWGTIWPIIIILIGVSLLHAPKAMRRTKNHSRSHKSGETELSDEMNMTAFFTGINQRVQSEDFIGGSISVMFGGAEVDLREVKVLTKKPIAIDLSAMFGGIEIFVPNDWKIKISGTPIFGGMDDKTRQIFEPDGKHPIVYINYHVMFGGVEIKN